MAKISIYGVGKTKENWLDQALQEYLKRLKPWCKIEFAFMKNDEQLIKRILTLKNGVCLEPDGRSLDSIQFAFLIERLFLQWGGEITFIIGGPAGLPKQATQDREIISLSPLTLTHQLTRLVLVEQIYRAFTLIKGTPYHK